MSLKQDSEAINREHAAFTGSAKMMCHYLEYGLWQSAEGCRQEAVQHFEAWADAVTRAHRHAAGFADG